MGVYMTFRVLVVLCLAGLSSWAQADTSRCYNIKNSDRKNFCLAIAKGERSYCYSIHEDDTKNFCLAQLNNQKSYCHSIRAQDTKNECLAVVR